MAEFDSTAVRKCLREGRLTDLFIEELGWDHHTVPLSVTSEGRDWTLQPIAHKRGLVVYRCAGPEDERLPEYAERRKIEQQVAKSVREHIIVFTDERATTQVWQWVKREAGKPAACREHPFHTTQSGDALAQKLRAIAISLEEEEAMTLPGVLSGVRAAFDVEKVTKRFYDQFKKQHADFLGFISGISDLGDREWYASVMLNRLMFVYFVQRKGFLDNDVNYLPNRLERCRREHGKDKFYSFYREFLLRLFHEGLGSKDRTPELNELLGRIPYLNGGLFEQHEIEASYPDIQMPDQAFQKVFQYFKQYEWHLDERALRAGNEINPDVLGYIFEKYINQKQMGAYYTKEDITEYIGKNTVIPFLLDAARAKCKVAFENPGGPTIWGLLRDDPDRYIYPAVRHGMDHALPDEIVVGISPPSLHKPVGKGLVKTLEMRKGWNRPAPPEFALPTETWREVVARRTRCAELRTKLVAGEVRDVNDLITFNLDIRQFAQDAIENCEGPALLRAFWQSIEKITILDPTCGSGAFLFAALNILEPLYEACLDRMEAFVEDLERSGEKHPPEKFSDFRRTLAHVAAHPNRSYFIFKSIILNNLYGVDIMEEAVEICKLRLFLKLAAQVDPDAAAENFGIEPLPDIDFNIRVGNTLVGFATYEEVRKSVSGELQGRQDLFGDMEKISVKAADLQQAFDAFRQRQVEGDGSVPAKDKAELRERLDGLDKELNQYLGREHGVDSANRRAYAKWEASHQPFHWFVEFYGIMEGGGFDVIIGNPPYVEYKDVKNEYKLIGFRTMECGDLYALCVERALELLRPNGQIGLIVPISIFGTDGFATLQQLTLHSLNPLWVSCYANRPSQLFDGSQKRLTIVIGQRSVTEDPTVFTTSYLRWKREEFEHLLRARIQYSPRRSIFSVFPASLEKLGSTMEVDVFSRLVESHARLEDALAEPARYRMYYTRKFGYFLAFLDFVPDITEIATGRRVPPSELKELGFRSVESLQAAVGALSASTFFWFWNVLSDCRNLNRRDLLAFTTNPDSLTPEMRRDLAALGSKYLKGLKRTSRVMVKSGLRIETFEYAASKPIIDEIDAVLAQYYSLTQEELDFIINYDIKYRMGRHGEGEEED